ncbi:hypothetical protein [Nitrincola alkalilacustris]|uniref:hypothetical protein n=1 Tax=Nitrincola alkalilacustris TaxID=1571224 RepID=UPI00124F3959|nr:hypothetical protein [Nitrincola alkalilacustris]
MLAALTLVALPASAEDVPNILDSGFEPDGRGGVARPWSTSQHSDHPSYVFSVDDGVLSIRRFDFEPWGQVAQRLDATPFAGKRLEFVVELSGEFDLSYGEPIEPTGISVVLRGLDEDIRYRMLGSQILKTPYASIGEFEGGMEWQPLSLVFDVPPLATELEVFVRMSLGGELRARNPRLTLVDPTVVD